MNGADLDAVITAGYDAALGNAAWPTVLGTLSVAFNCHFADLFARTTDYSEYAGICHGLDERDYQDVFLDTWVKRNVWGKRHPTRMPGEIVTTRDMIEPAALMREQMFGEYLAPRGLHEGLRLTLAARGGWVQDISLLRSWSAGAFTAEERWGAGLVLPHLQRAIDISRRLRETERQANVGTQVGASARDVTRDGIREGTREGTREGSGQATLVLDRLGRALHTDAAADRLLAEGDGLMLGADGLRAVDRVAQRALAAAVERATCGAETTPAPVDVSIPRPSGRAEYRLTLIPVRETHPWLMLRASTVLVLIGDPDASSRASAMSLVAQFGLTAAEAELARHLVAGRSLAEVSEVTARSLSTVRTHLARLMAKTHTRRQGDLVRALMVAVQVKPELPSRS